MNMASPLEARRARRERLPMQAALDKNALDVFFDGNDILRGSFNIHVFIYFKLCVPFFIFSFYIISLSYFKHIIFNSPENLPSQKESSLPTIIFQELY